MKKLTYIIGIMILVLALAVGCTTDENDPGKVDEDQGVIDKDEDEDIDEAPDEDDNRTAEDILKDFGDKVEDSLTDAGEFIDKNVEKLSEIEIDQMVSDLINKTEDGIDKVKQKIQEIEIDNELMDSFDGDLYLTQDRIDKLENEELRDELNRIHNENYRLINLEGEYYPIVNYEGFKRYDEHVSEEVRDYIDLKARDADKPVATDASLYITYDELADRIVATENYVKKYGEGDRYGEALNMYRNKLHAYLLGLPNTPMTEIGSDKIKEDLMDSYKQTALIKDSSTAFIVGKYIAVIDSKQGVIDDEVKAQAELLLEEATELIGTGK